MPQHVCNGAMLMCSFGTAPSTLVVLPTGRVNTSLQPAGTIMDHVSQMNVAPFALCMSLANPQVVAATAAAMGVLTPQPCMPLTVTPWTPGSPTVTIGHLPVLRNTDTLQCMWAGVITVAVPGQVTENAA